MNGEGRVGGILVFITNWKYQTIFYLVVIISVRWPRGVKYGCDYYLSISMHPCEHEHSWERKPLSLLLLVYKQTAWGLLPYCMEPTTEAVNNWDIFLLVFYMSGHQKMLSHLEKLYSDALTIPNSNKLKSWIGNVIWICQSRTGQ